MSCQAFETIIVEIARDRLMDALARERGLEHIAACASCAAFLAEERALSLRLRAFAVEAAKEERPAHLPAHLEAALLTALRQRVATPEVKPLASAPSSKRRWLLAVAALLLGSMGLSWAGWIISSPRSEATLVGTPAEKVVPPVTPQVAASESKERPKPPTAAETQVARLVPPAKSQRRQLRLAETAARQPIPAANEPQELVTAFFPVNQGSELIPLEGGQIVRVKMPRSNLISLGLPLSQERAEETIQADVLVSNDGLARAIRLVY